MKKHILPFCVCILFLTGCAAHAGGRSEGIVSGGKENWKKNPTEISMQIDNISVDVEWENNQTVKELKEVLAQRELTVRLSKYGDFEQVGELGKHYSSSDKRMTTEAGDIMLYSGNKIVVFYGQNTWEYTRIGKIRNLGENEIRRLLSAENVELKLALK